MCSMCFNRFLHCLLLFKELCCSNCVLIVCFHRFDAFFITFASLFKRHGNFGSQDNDPPAAMRYTECKLSALAQQCLLTDMELNTVDFVPNFDGNEVEPVILPSRFPMLLLNGASGIAVGMATNIPPHNFGELASAIEVMVNKRINSSDSNCSNSSDNEITTEELYAIVPAPDFPTGGVIMGQEKAKQLYDTGRGSILLRAKANIETLKLKSSNGKILQKEAIIVTEVPYLCNKATLLERIAELVNDKKLNGISDLRDESDREGVRIVIELKKDAVGAVVLNNLYMKTGLQSTFSGNFLALSKVMNMVLFVLFFFILLRIQKCTYVLFVVVSLGVISFMFFLSNHKLLPTLFEQLFENRGVLHHKDSHFWKRYKSS